MGSLPWHSKVPLSHVFDSIVLTSSSPSINSGLKRKFRISSINSPSLLKRGVRHVEEMQLFSVGIGPDRVSDIIANLPKDTEYWPSAVDLRLR